MSWPEPEPVYYLALPITYSGKFPSSTVQGLSIKTNAADKGICLYFLGVLVNPAVEM